jgi:hypothetical protein
MKILDNVAYLFFSSSLLEIAGTVSLKWWSIHRLKRPVERRTMLFLSAQVSF